MLTDYWAHKFLVDPKAAEEVEDDDFDLDEVVKQMEQNPDEWQSLS
jgi:hypothetical protein